MKPKPKKIRTLNQDPKLAKRYAKPNSPQFIAVLEHRRYLKGKMA